jgi:hypothetical protein
MPEGFNEAQAEAFSEIADGTQLAAWPDGTFHNGDKTLDAGAVQWLLREGYLGSLWQPTNAGKAAFERYQRAHKR